MKKESAIVTACCNWLALLENSGKLVYQRNNTGAVVTREFGRKARFLRFGKKGASDILIFCPGGRTLHVEVKSDVGKMSFEQMEYEHKITALGHTYYLIRSLDELENILKDVGAI